MKMPTDLRARVPIDDRLLEALSELKRNKGHNGTVEFLGGKEKGFTKFVLYNIQGRHHFQKSIPYDLYLGVVGKEGAEEIPWEKIRFRESLDLVRKISYWHCFFFDIKKGEFAEDVAGEAERHGIVYSPHSMETILFYDTRLKNAEPEITDIVAKMFNDATSGEKPYSLDQIEDLVNYFDSIHSGQRDPNTVSWSVAEPVVDSLIRFTGKSFRALMGDGIRRLDLERGGKGGRKLRKLSIKQYSALLREVRELPPYRLLQVLNGDNTLRGIIARDTPSEYVPAVSGLTGEELQLIRQGNQIYGEAFMQHIFPVYIAIKHEHGFPTEYFEWVVRFPSGEVIGRYYRPPEVISGVPTYIVAGIVKSHLIYYKEILGINASRGYKMSVTADGLGRRLREAGTQIREYASQHLMDLDGYRNSSRLPRP